MCTRREWAHAACHPPMLRAARKRETCTTRGVLERATCRRELPLERQRVPHAAAIAAIAVALAHDSQEFFAGLALANYAHERSLNLRVTASCKRTQSASRRSCGAPTPPAAVSGR